MSSFWTCSAMRLHSNVKNRGANPSGFLGGAAVYIASMEAWSTEYISSLEPLKTNLTSQTTMFAKRSCIPHMRQPACRRNRMIAWPETLDVSRIHSYGSDPTWTPKVCKLIVVWVLYRRGSSSNSSRQQQQQLPPVVEVVVVVVVVVVVGVVAAAAVVVGEGEGAGKEEEVVVAVVVAVVGMVVLALVIVEVQVEE